VTLIKYVIGAKRIGIITDSYGHNLAFINKICNELRKDYPELTDEDIDVLPIAGPRHNRQFAFEATVETVNEQYKPYPADWLVCY